MLSDACLELGGEVGVGDFVRDHLLNSLRSEQLVAAVFSGTTSTVRASCRRLLDGTSGRLKDHAKHSRQVAATLGEIVQDDKRVAPGALLVCRFTASFDSGDDGERLALLKLDPSDGFSPRQTKKKDGQTVVTLQKLDRVVPSTREQLQKCAFVLPRILDDEPDDSLVDLLILDRQRRGSKEPADFFMSRFLEARRARDAASLTEDFHKAAFNAVERAFGAELISSDERQELQAAKDVALTGGAFNPVAWVNARPISEAAKELVTTEFEQKMLNQEVIPDVETGRRLTRRRQFHGDHGLKVILDAAHYDDLVDAEQVTDDAGDTAWKVTLTTKRWNEVRR